MAIQWFYQASEGQESGPVDSGELRRLAEVGIVRPETLVRRGDSGRWVRAEQVRGLFQRSTPAPSLGATPPGPPPLPPPVARLSTGSGESPIRHGVGAAAVSEASEKPKRVWPVPWAAMIAGSGIALLLLLWALMFRGGSTPQQEPDKDQPLLAAAQSAELGSSAAAPQPLAPQSSETPTHLELADGRGSSDGKQHRPDALSPGQPPPVSHTPQQPVRPKPPPQVAAAGVPSLPGAVLELADLAELVGPSVVQVDVTGPEAAATGSGFVLDKQGTIVTNFHVIEDATAGRIVFSDKTSAPITGYLGVWPEKDIALVRVECPPEKLHPLRLATSAPRQGERVAAFGSPLGLQQSVSEGIVSAVRESEELRALGPIDINARLIQTTTPISHGNSGGPLVDMKGMLVGVNTMTFRPLGGENVNFAVAAVELPPLLLAKNETPSPLPASDPAAGGVRRILRRAEAHMDAGDYDRAIADCTEAIRLEPKNARAYFMRGEVYRRKRDYDSAIADYTDAIRLDPQYASAYCWRGLVYFFKDDYDSAIADYTEAIRLDPKTHGTYFNRGRAYSKKADQDSAIADFTETIRLGLKDAPVYHFRGLAYHLKRDYDRGIADYTEAIRLDPTDADTYCLRGDAFHRKRDYDSAIADYTEAIRLEPENAGGYEGRAWAYRAKEDYDSAIADFTDAIRLDPTDADTYAYRGLVYNLKRDYDRGIADYTEAIRLDPKYADAYFHRGAAYAANGDADRAIADFTETIRLGLKDAPVYRFRGLAYEAIGQRAAAERDFAEAERLGYNLPTPAPPKVGVGTPEVGKSLARSDTKETLRELVVNSIRRQLAAVPRRQLALMRTRGITAAFIPVKPVNISQGQVVRIACNMTIIQVLDEGILAKLDDVLCRIETLDGDNAEFAAKIGNEIVCNVPLDSVFLVGKARSYPTVSGTEAYYIPLYPVSAILSQRDFAALVDSEIRGR